MRKIYLIRHGEPEFPGGVKFCLGRKELPLGRLGKMQSALLADWFSDKGGVTFFSSEMLRAKETAGIITADFRFAAGLEEISMGEWEGLSFDSIREQYPELYEKRGGDPVNIPAPGGESMRNFSRRVTDVFRALLDSTEGDIALISHAGVNRAILCSALGLPLEAIFSVKQSYGCLSELVYDKGELRVITEYIRPKPPLSPSLCERLLLAADTPEEIRAHCRAVAEKAIEIGSGLNERGLELDLKLLYSSALLHDAVRTEKNHASVGGALITALGYPEHGRVIAAHHELQEEAEVRISEETVLFYADKLFKGKKEVSVDERFAVSRASCLTPEGRAAWERRYVQTKKVAGLIEERLAAGR